MAELSPAAQAVLDAANKAYWLFDQMCPADANVIAAAAMRAAAEDIGPSEILPPGYAYSAPAEELYYQFRLKAKGQLLAIAAELES